MHNRAEVLSVRTWRHHQAVTLLACAFVTGLPSISCGALLKKATVIRGQPNDCARTLVYCLPFTAPAEGGEAVAVFTNGSEPIESVHVSILPWSPCPESPCDSEHTGVGCTSSSAPGLVPNEVTFAASGPLTPGGAYMARLVGCIYQGNCNVRVEIEVHADDCP